MLQFWREALLSELGFTTFKRNPCVDGVRIRLAQPQSESIRDGGGQIWLTMSANDDFVSVA